MTFASSTTSINAEQEDAPTSAHDAQLLMPTPPLPQRTLTHFAPADAPVEPVEPAPSSCADELELLHAMLGGERKVRMLEPYDGTRFVLHVEAAGDPAAGYLILDFALPAAYPDEQPLVTSPYGQVGSRELSVDEAAAAANYCRASVSDDALSGPVLYSMYDAAREWLADMAVVPAA